MTYHPEGGGESSLQLSDPAATEATLTDLENHTCYTITVVATAGEHRREGVVRTVLPQLQGKPYDKCLHIQILNEVIFQLQDIPRPVGVRAEATADNSSIRVSWQWSPQGVLVCVSNVRVCYQPEGGSLMMYTVDNTAAIRVILSNLQCNTKYTVWIQVRGSSTGRRRSPSRTVYLPGRGMYL